VQAVDLLRLALLILVLSSPLASAQWPPAKELLRLDGPVLFERLKAMERERLDGPALLQPPEGDDKNFPYTAAELIALSTKLAPTIKRFSEIENYDYDHPFTDFFGQACKHAKADQFGSLLEAFRRVPIDSVNKSSEFPALAAACLRDNIPAHARRDPRAHERWEQPAGPAKLADAPESLIRAWELYEQQIANYERELRAHEGEDFGKDKDEAWVYGIIDEALGGDAVKGAGELSKLPDPPPSCFDEPTGDAKTLSLLVAFLRQRRYEEARGAALLGAETESILHGAMLQEQLFALFEALQVNWETALVGRLAGSEAKGRTNKYLHGLIGGYGGDKAASLINQLVAWLPPERRPDYVSLLAAFIEDAPKPMDAETQSVASAWSSNDVHRRVKVPVALSIQKESLRLIEEMVSPTCPDEVAFAAVRIFARTRSTTSIPALQRLAQSNGANYRRDAAIVLGAIEASN
jgi:hypothetical protein